MTYSCALFSRGARTLEEAQVAKLELVLHEARSERGRAHPRCRLWLGAASCCTPPPTTGVRCGRHHPLPVQAELARRRVAEAELGDRVEIRIADYRDLRGERYDAIASIGHVEHVGSNQIDVYAAQLAGLLEPGGRLLNQRHRPPAPWRG